MTDTPTLVIPPENRVYTVVVADRTFVVPPEARVVSMPLEQRVLEAFE